MKYTTKLNLNKPDLTDYVSVEDLNENMDILDATVGELKEGTAVLSELETVDKTLVGAINEVDGKVTDVKTEVELNTSDITTHLAERATKEKYGHVKIGGGLNVVDGVLSAGGELVIEKFVTPGTFTWTVPEGVTKVYVSGAGGGGGGGTYNVTTPVDGGAGGITSFGNKVSLSGGGGGTGYAGGVGVGTGSNGGKSTITGGVSDAAAIGGSSIFGAGGVSGSTTVSAGPGAGYGSGGGGAGSGGAGGGGGADAIIDTEFTVQPLDIVTIKIGAGGGGGNAALKGGNGAKGFLLIKYIK